MPHRLVLPSALRTAAAIVLIAAATVITPSVVDAQLGCPVGQVRWGPPGMACYNPAFSLGAARGAYFYNSNIPLMIATGQAVVTPTTCNTITLINPKVTATVPPTSSAPATTALATTAVAAVAVITTAPATTIPPTTVAITTSPATTDPPTTAAIVPTTVPPTTATLTTSPATTVPPTTPALTASPTPTPTPTATITTIPPTTVPAGAFQPYHKVYDYNSTIGPGAATGFRFTLAPDNITYWQMLQNDATGYGTILNFNRAGGAYAQYPIKAFASADALADASAPKWPIGSLLLHTNGLFYGFVVKGTYTFVNPYSPDSGSFFSINPATSVFNWIYDFTGNYGTPSRPSTGLLQSNIAGSQMMYGVTNNGCEQLDSLGNPKPGYAGGLFSINTIGNATCLYSFFKATDGSSANGAMIQDAAGVLYGTMSNGDYASGTCSAVYKFVIGTNTYTRLHSFTTAGNDCLVMASVTLVIDSSNVQWLYGMSSQNGTNANAGSLFRMLAATGASYSVLHAFAAATDGNKPYATLTLATNGVLYGTTSKAGPGLCGGIFSYAPATSIYTNLYTFNNTGDSTDTCNSMTPLLQGPGGYLMGSGGWGGVNGDGTIFSYQILDY